MENPARLADEPPTRVDNRHAHPQPVETRGVAVVGKGIKRGVDPAIRLHVLTARPISNELDARRIDPERLEHRTEFATRMALRRQQNHARAGNAVEHFGP